MENSKQGRKKKLLISLAVVFAIGIAYLAYFLILEYKVHSKQREIRKAGYPASPEELEKWYAEPPAGKNAAPVYEEAFKNFCENPAGVDTSKLVICGSADLPALEIKIPDEMIETARKYLTANSKAIELVHKASSMDSCRFQVEISDAERSLAYHSKLRQAARILYLQAVISSEEGNLQKAFESAIDSCRLTMSLENEPLPDSFITQMALEHMALDSVERLIARGGLDEKQLSQIGKEVSRFESMKSLERAYAGERALVLSEYYLEEFMEYAVYGFPGFVRSSPFLKKMVFFLFDVSCLRMINNLSGIGFLTELIELSKNRPESILSPLKKIDGKIDCLPSYLFAVKIYMPHLCSITEKKILLVSRTRVVLTAVAVESYLLINKKLPENLSVPVDPVDGKPVRYVKTEKGFLIYSTGADGQDNKGNSGSNRGFSPGEDFSVKLIR